MRKIWPVIVLLYTFCSLLIFPACSKDKSKQTVKAAPPVPVTVGTVVRESVPLQISAIGNVEAYSKVGIKSQVGGTLMRVHFKEGQDVKKGDLLFTIDSRPYEAALRQAEATLARDKVQLENTRVEVSRYAELVKKGYVAQEQYDQIRTNSAALESTVNVDEAALENARLQLGYCLIYAPVSGRTGSLLSYEGNLIKANADTNMVVINKLQPVYVTFSVPEKDLQEIRKYMASGELNVEALISNEISHPEEGLLTFIDNTVDASTGTIKLKATFPNNDKQLWPGQFVNVVITIATLSDAIVLPSEAIQTGQQGEFVFAIKDGIAELRPVTTGVTYEGITVIEKGLADGEQVVTDGHMRVIPGGTVEIKNPTGAENKKLKPIGTPSDISK